MDVLLKNKTNMFIFITLEYPDERVTNIHEIEILENVIKVTYEYAWKHTIVGWVKEASTLYIDKNRYTSFLNNTLMEGIK